MIEIEQCYDNECNEIEMYWLSFNDLIYDKYIAQAFGISLWKYNNILKKFGAKKYGSLHDLFFFNKEDAEKALNYLNDTYVIIYKLKQ